MHWILFIIPFMFIWLENFSSLPNAYAAYFSPIYAPKRIFMHRNCEHSENKKKCLKHFFRLIFSNSIIIFLNMYVISFMKGMMLTEFFDALSYNK